MRIVRACRALGHREPWSAVSEVDREQHGRAARRPRRLHRPGARRPRATCAPRRSSRPPSAPAATRSTPATASSPRTRASRRSRASRGSSFVGPPPEVIELAGDKLRARGHGAGGRAAARARRRGRGRSTPRTRSPPTRATRCCSRPRAAAAAAASSSRATRPGSDALFGVAVAEARRRLRRPAPVRRALHRRRPPRRGADRRRHARRRRPPRRARLLGPAPLPEGHRGGPRAVAHAGRARGAHRRRGRLRRARSATVNLGTVEFMVDAATGEHFFLEVQLPHPGRAPGHRGGHRPRPRRRAAPDRRGRAAELRPGRRGARRPRDRVPPDRRGRRRTASARARAARTLRGPGPDGPPRRHPLRRRRADPAALRLADGQADRPRPRPRERRSRVLREALAGLEVEGVETQPRAARGDVLAHRDFAAGAVTTRWLEEEALA